MEYVFLLSTFYAIFSLLTTFSFLLLTVPLLSYDYYDYLWLLFVLRLDELLEKLLLLGDMDIVFHVLTKACNVVWLNTLVRRH